MLQYAAENLGWIVAILGGLGTLAVVARSGKRRAAKAVAKVSQINDVLLGRPPILHPETGEELVPETPGIGTRMAHIERWQEEAGGILGKLADTQSEIVRTNTRVDDLSDKLTRHVDSGCVGGTCPAGLPLKLDQTIKVQTPPS